MEQSGLREKPHDRDTKTKTNRDRSQSDTILTNKYAIDS